MPGPLKRVGQDTLPFPASFRGALRRLTKESSLNEQYPTHPRVERQVLKHFIGGQVLITRGVATLPAALRSTLIEQVQTFSAFTEDNGPHGEHDFGAFTVGNRILTIMLAQEY